MRSRKAETHVPARARQRDQELPDAGGRAEPWGLDAQEARSRHAEGPPGPSPCASFASSDGPCVRHRTIRHQARQTSRSSFFMSSNWQSRAARGPMTVTSGKPTNSTGCLAFRTFLETWLNYVRTIVFGAWRTGG